MNVPTLESQRITLRPFHETDMEIIKSLLNDPLATSNLPWVSAPSHLNAENFYTRLIANSPYFFIIEMKNYDLPIGFMKVSTTQNNLMDFALLQEYWQRDVLIEAFQLIQPYLIQQGVPNLLIQIASDHKDSCDFAKRTDFLYEYSYTIEDGSTVRLYQKILNPEKLDLVQICGKNIPNTLSKPFRCKSTDWNPSRCFFEKVSFILLPTKSKHSHKLKHK